MSLCTEWFQHSAIWLVWLAIQHHFSWLGFIFTIIWTFWLIGQFWHLGILAELPIDWFNSLPRLQSLHLEAQRRQRILSCMRQLPGPETPPFYLWISTIWTRAKELPFVARMFERIAWQYGPITKIWIAPWKPVVLLSDAQAIRRVMRQRPSHCTRQHGTVEIFSELNAHGLFSEDDDAWRRSRHWITPAFAPRRVRAMRSMVFEHLSKLKEQFSELSTKQMELLSKYGLLPDSKQRDFDNYANSLSLFDPLHDLQQMALRIIVDYALTYGNSEFATQRLLSNMETMTRTTATRLLVPIKYWRYLPFDLPRDRNLYKAIDEFYATVDLMVDKFVQSSKNVKTDEDRHCTLLETLVLEDNSTVNDKSSSTKKYSKMAPDQIRGNILHVIIAGYETASTTMHWTLFYLATHPAVQQQLHNEVDALVFGTEHEKIENKTDRLLQMNFEDWDTLLFGDAPIQLSHEELTHEYDHDVPFNRLPFATAILREVMRLRPVGPTLFTSPKQDIQVLDQTLPAGIDLLCLLRVAAFRAWPDHDYFDFRPNRWLDTSDQSKMKERQQLWFVFGSGTRICPGRHLAMLEMVLTLVCCFAAFEIGRAPCSPAEDEGPGLERFHFAVQCEGLAIWLKKR